MIPLHDDNPTSIKPYVTIGLIALCTMVFFWQISLGNAIQQAIISLGVIPSVLFNFKLLSPELIVVPPLMTIFTSMFLHGGWMHLIGNMLYLWIFGNNVEDVMGHGRFIIFYLLCGTAAVLAQAIPDPQSDIPMVGASGAISGVLGAYILLYPHARILIAIPLGFYIHTMRLPAGIVLGLWFILQLVNSSFVGSEGGVAFGAHIGGFVSGMVLILFFRRKGVRLFKPARGNRL